MLGALPPVATGLPPMTARSHRRGLLPTYGASVHSWAGWDPARGKHNPVAPAAIPPIPPRGTPYGMTLY